MSHRLDRALEDLDRDAVVRPGDEDLILRAADAALARSNASASATVLRPKAHGGWRVVQVAAAAIFMLSAGAGAAWWVATASQAEPTKQVEAAATKALRKRSVATAPQVAAPSDEPAVVTPALDEGRDEPVQPRAHERRAVPLDAASLFHGASVARGAGDVTRAQRLYLQLIAQHPDSDEAHVAHVALGKLLLSAGRASAAEREFRQYLDAGGGPLSEEALFSRAQALQRLERLVEERAAWTKLLSTYPQSVYATHARERLADR